MTRNNGRRLAVGVVPMETRREVVVRLARRAEESGYDAFFVAEGWGHDATAVLAEIAVHTERIQIGSGVLNVWGRSAATIAMSATSLADLSGGRYVLGLGAGSPALAQGWHGVPFEDPVGRLRTVTRQVRRLLDGERLDASVGSMVPSLRLAVPAATRIPIGLAALGPEAVRLAGEVADAWMPFFLPRAALPAAVRQVREAAGSSAEATRPDQPTICPAIPVAVSPDGERAEAVADWWITFYLTRMGPLYQQTLRRSGFDSDVDALVAAPGSPPSEVAPRLIDELTLCGSPERALASLDDWYAAGADTPCLVLPPGHDADELEELLVALA
jgi:alkanesulfonate monooxygenase SsuD/methylene tetrahydromethanopterin reductase-like flavin-dependent oxidoreductase (luciferase family)